MNGKKLITLGGTMVVLLGTVFSAATQADHGQPPHQKAAKTDVAAAPVETNLLDYDPAVSLQVRSSTRTDSCLTYDFRFTFDEGAVGEDEEPNNYLLGYYGTGDNYKPLSVSYDVTHGGKTESRVIEIANPGKLNPYISFGPDLGSLTQSIYAYLSLDKDETIKTTSVKIFNIYKADKDAGDQYVPDYAANYYIMPETIPSPQKLEDFTLPTFKKFSTFNGYTSAIFDFDVVALAKYKTLKSSAYKKFEDVLRTSELDNPDATNYIRYQLYSLVNTYFEITFKDGVTKTYPIRGTSIITLHEGHNTINFLIDGIDPYQVQTFRIKQLVFYMDIATISTHKMAVGSNVSYMFGDLEFDMEKAKIGNINNYLIIATVLFLALFIAGDLALYFYRKNKYKNDEFRRVNPRQYFKISGMSFLATGSFYYAILFIFYRAGSLNSSLKVYNPCDIPIVIFCVMSILLGGYFVKYFTTLFKDHKTKKNVERLKLNATDKKDDDGTN